MEIPQKSIRAIEIQNVEMVPEYLEQKFSRLDLRMDVDGTKVNVEMQVNYEPDFRERTLFYWSRMFGEELKSGEEYGELKRTVCINIINFNLFHCQEYHSHFQLLENQRHELLTDKLAIHFFELKKIGNIQEQSQIKALLGE